MVMVNKSQENIVHALIVILGIVFFLIIYVIATENKEEVRIEAKNAILLKEVYVISNQLDNWFMQGQSDTFF